MLAPEAYLPLLGALTNRGLRVKQAVSSEPDTSVPDIALLEGPPGPVRRADLLIAMQYGYGIVPVRVGPHRMFFHNGELPGYNTFAGYDAVNRVTLVLRTSLPVSVDHTGPAEQIAGKVFASIYRDVPDTVDPDVAGD